MTSVGGRHSSYTSLGKYGVSVETLLAGLRVSLNVNKIKLKKVQVIYNADDLNASQLDGYVTELSKILRIE